MSGGGDARDRAAGCPFLVLELGPGATRTEVERQGQRLLDALALGLASAACYPTPLGPRPRTAEDVREALAALRDPDRRVLHEAFAAPPPTAPPAPAAAPWPDAFAALGWSRR